ncbi:MAG: AAA family ATPase [Rhodobacter sp.]|nr:AAA family ATPase [Rhodobacter sp.]
MRLVGLSVENFRCYVTPISVRFDNLTALVGRNDVGKSSLMDALARDCAEFCALAHFVTPLGSVLRT